MASTPRAIDDDDDDNDDDDNDDDDDDDMIRPRPPDAPHADVEPIQPAAARTLRNRPRLNYANDGALLAQTTADEADESPDDNDGRALGPVRARPPDPLEPPSRALAALRLGVTSGAPAPSIRILANHQHPSGASAVVAHAAGNGWRGTIDEELGWGALGEPSPDPADARAQSPYAPLGGSSGDVCTFGQPFDQIDVRHLLGVDGFSFHQMNDIPVSLREPFALALVDVLSALEDAGRAGDLVGRDRALKGLALLPTLLLRLPPPGSERTTTHVAMVHARIGKWVSGDIDALVQDLASDAHINAAASALAPGHSNSSGDAASKARAQAAKFIRMGDLGRARRAITSDGCADLRDPAVVTELASKYPQTRRAIDSTFLDEQDFPRVKVDESELAKVFGRLDPLTAQGVSGWRNPYLKAVSFTDSFATQKAKTVMPLLQAYSERYMNGDLPEWWYFVTGSTRGVALNKPGRQAGVRPIGITCRLHAAVERAAFFADAVKAEWAAHLAMNGQQAVGVKGGITSVALSASLFYDLDPDGVQLNLDCANAFNEIERAAVIAQLASPDTPDALRAFARHALATLSPAAAIVFNVGGSRKLMDQCRSVQGVTQGSVSSMPYFCMAIHAALGRVQTDENLATLCFADDISLLGKAADMAAALPGLKADLLAVGLRLQEHKSSYACPPHAEVDALAHIGDHGAGIPHGEYAPPGETTQLFGHIKCGIPIGEPAFVLCKLSEKYAEIAAEIRLVHAALRGEPQLQFIMLRGSSVFRLDYLAQHCHPDDMAGIAANFDALIRELLEDALGVKLDAVAAERAALSVRNGGFGLRSRETLLGPAAMGALVKTVRRLLPTDMDGGILNGNLTAIVDAVGRGSFDDGKYDLGTFIASGSRHGSYLASWWADAQGYASGTIGQAPSNGALAKDVEQAGMGLSNPQHALTSQLESVARAAFIDALPFGSREYRAITLNDRFSQAPFTLAPSLKVNKIAADEFREMGARYIGAASPACVPFVGRPLDVSGRGGDGTVDKFGDNLITACTTGHHDANFRHNPLRDAVVHVAKLFGAVYVRAEDGHYFLRALTPQALFAAINEGNLTTRLRGVTPDITIRLDPSSQQKIYEVKVIGYCKSWYPELPVTSSAKYGVEKRAQSVPGEYARKLRAHDVKFGMRARASDGGPPGPLEASLATANLQVLVSGAFGEGNKGLHSFVRELAVSGAPRLQAKLGLDAAAAAARIRRVAYERIGLAIARGHAQQLLARLGCVDVLRAHRNGAHVGDAVLACESPTLLIASDRSN